LAIIFGLCYVGAGNGVSGTPELDKQALSQHVLVEQQVGLMAGVVASVIPLAADFSIVETNVLLDVIMNSYGI
jgi:hypothetical protein